MAAEPCTLLDVAEMARRLAAHAECLDRALGDPQALADPLVRVRLRAMADAARATATAAGVLDGGRDG